MDSIQPYTASRRNPLNAIPVELSRTFWSCSSVLICVSSMVIVMDPDYHAQPPMSQGTHFRLILY